MTEAVVSMILNRLTPVIEEKVREEVCLLLNANKEAKTMSSKLEKILRVLDDADRQVVADPRIRSWLDKLQEIAYEIDDALDEWEVENIRRKLKESEDASSDDPRMKVCSFLKSLCACFKRTARRRRIALDIKSINDRLDTIDEENEREFKFIPKIGGVPTYRDFKPVETTSFVDESDIFGRDYDKNMLMSKILSSSSTSSSQGNEEIQVISIWGTGGMGKTTLAQLVFNEIKKGNKFKPIWVCVSDPFDGVKVSQTILDQLGASYPSNSQLSTLLKRIEESILEKRFFLVLDDVWTEDDTIWKQLRASLSSGAPGSRILVTTRKERVADVVRSTYKHQLGRLSDPNCWLLMSRIALNERSDLECEILKGTGEAIAEKCNGMPLAAKAMGGLLRYKESLQEWEDVLKSGMWELKTMKEEVFPVIALSYNELDPAIKRCFSYCAIFPKDSVIYVDDLIRFWMAQGFLSTNENTELLGRAYFMDLATRSFFQDFERDDTNCIFRILERGDSNCIFRCKMHDIVHDFAQLLTKNECVLVEEYEGAVSVHANVRHLNLMIYGDKVGVTGLSPKLRSLLCEGIKLPAPNWFSHLKRVRLLKLVDFDLQDIPENIGNLIHLRFLDLSSNHKLKKLPESICDLYNLQTLGIRNCDLQDIPENIGNLIHLRFLDLSENDNLRTLPEAICDLYNLQTLGIARCDLQDIPENIGNLIHLRCLDLRQNNKLRKLPEAICDLYNLQTLGIDHCYLQDIPENIGNLIHFRFLDLRGNNLKKLPEAICDLYNLQTLNIRYCYSLCGLPQGVEKLTNLRHLLNQGIAWDFEYPQGFEKLTNLRTLEVYCVSSSKLGYLKDMNQLQGSLDIEIRDGFDMVDFKKADLKNKKFLQELCFVSRGSVDGLPVIIDGAQPPPNLERVTFKGVMLPKWTTTLTNLRKFYLIEDPHESRPRPNDYPGGNKSFPCLGKLPFLEELEVGSMKALEHIGDEFLGVNRMNETTMTSFVSFPKLVRLEISNCPMWEEWEDISEEEAANSSISILPCLELLEICRCDKLKALPHRFLCKASSLQELRVYQCRTLWSRYNRETGQDWDKISHIKDVRIIQNLW